MALAPMLAELDDVADSLMRPLTDVEGQRAIRLIVKATALLRVKAPWVDDRLADETLSPIAVASAVGGVVARTMRNPTGSVSITTGPYSRTLQARGGLGSDGDLAVTDSDVAKLTAALQRGAPGSIKLKAALAPRVVVDRHGRVTELGLVGYPQGLSGALGLGADE